jgi:lysophospholipase L1-like esterase
MLFKKAELRNGRALLSSPTGLSADLVHPSSDGMNQIASNLVREIKHA